MPLSNLVDDYYFNLNAIHTTSQEFSELASNIPTAAISQEFSELSGNIPATSISSEMNSVGPKLVIVKGTNLSTGSYSSLNPGDNIVRSDGSGYGVTGVRGNTGFPGVTGISGTKGETGLVGTTGILGITGFSINGITGSIGLTGMAGITGNQSISGDTGISIIGNALGGISVPGITGFIGITGAFGFTGILGITGLVGNTGSNAIGVTGTGPIIAGPTGIIGLSGISSSATGIEGATGITIGSTGLHGLGGSTGLKGYTSDTITTLSSQTNEGTSLSYNVPGATLSVDGGRLVFLTWGTSSTSWASSDLSITLGGSTLLLKTLEGAGGVDFYVKGVIIRVSSSIQQNLVYLIGSYGVIFTQITTTTVDLTAAQSLTVSATSNSIINALIVRKVLA